MAYYGARPGALWGSFQSKCDIFNIKKGKKYFLKYKIIDLEIGKLKVPFTWHKHFVLYSS